MNFRKYSLRRRQQDGSWKPETGLKGDITFTPSNASPLGNHVKLLQTSKVTLTGGLAEYKWTGTEAQRENVRTTGAGGGDAGYFVDTGYGPYAPRTQKTDPTISPYYYEQSNVINAQTQTFDEAVKNFNEYFRNPGSTKAP